MSLILQKLRLTQARFTMQLDVTLNHSITGIFGPSGAGKTSLLDVIAGLRRPQTGRIQIENTLLFDADARTDVPPRLRRIGYVPQDLALFPHLVVRANLLYGHRTSGADNRMSLEHVAEVMEIVPLLGRDVMTLSGGEQQRVAFARAVLSNPRLLLLDEPMSSLDARLKTRLLPYLRRIRDEFHIPLIYVTHDADELGELCDEVLMMDAGSLVQRGPPASLLNMRSPRNGSEPRRS